MNHRHPQPPEGADTGVSEPAIEPLESLEPGSSASEDHWDGPLLEVQDLHTVFATEAGLVRAVDGVSFHVDRGDLLAIVGESGSGKTVTAMSILGLLPKPSGKITEGRVLFKGQDLVQAHPKQLRSIRGDRIAMVFQDPLTSMNPVHRVGDQIAEIILAHRDVSKDAARKRAVELLAEVGIANAQERAHAYPHHFSGGMRQRAMIAMAIANDPDLLIADEPTTALDVTVQAQILEVLQRVRQRFGTAIILITHDLGVVAELAERVLVMYAGKKVEEGTVDEIFDNAKHPYAWGLLGSTTRPDVPRTERLYQIPGAPPSLINPPKACRFAPRCKWVQPICREDYPFNREVDGPGHEAACHFAQWEDWTSDIEPSEVALRAARLQGADVQ